MAFIYLGIQIRSGKSKENAKGVRHLQPRVARGSALPWVSGVKKRVATLKGLRNRWAFPIGIAFGSKNSILIERLAQPLQGCDKNSGTHFPG